MSQQQATTWPGFPMQSRLGHPWQPGTVVIEWRPSECATAKQARGGHIQVHCAAPQCTEQWEKPRHDAASLRRPEHYRNLLNVGFEVTR